MNGHDASDEELAQPPDEEEEEERRQHLADILERATAIHYSSSSETVTPNNGPSMNARRTGNRFLGQESRDARTRLRRALLASSLGIPPRTTDREQHMPQDDRQIPTEPELTLADLDGTLNNSYDYQIRPNFTVGDATTTGNTDEVYGHYSAPQLATTSSLVMDTDEDDYEERYQPSQVDHTNFHAAPQEQGGRMTGDRARLRAMLLRGLAVPSTSQDIGVYTGHSSTNPPRTGTSGIQQQQPPPPHHVDATISLRAAIQRAHRDLVVLDDEFRRMCEAARSRRVDEDGNELQFDMDGVEEEQKEETSSHEHDQEQQEQLAHIVLPSSASAVARQASTFSSSSLSSSHEDQPRPKSEGEEQAQEDRSKARANANVAGTAILPLARKDTKRAQAA